MEKQKAVILIGPTGSGKTPLGNVCEQKGLLGKKCAHFDFGEQLRKIANTPNPDFLNKEDMKVIAHSLKTGTLLENETFYIAEKILSVFMTKNHLGADDILLLNGLPRHLGQAKDIDTLVEIQMVIHLNCSSEIVCQRIQLNSGGDRESRIDDSPEEVEKKWNLFQQRTIPLLEYYQAQGTKIEQLDISVETTAEDLYEKLSSVASHMFRSNKSKD